MKVKDNELFKKKIKTLDEPSFFFLILNQETAEIGNLCLTL